MGKRDNHQRDLIVLLEEYQQTGGDEPLLGYIVSNSNLPGPRGNLELAQAFGDAAEDCAAARRVRLWELYVRMSELPPEEAPVNDPRELIPFCGAIGIGALGSISPAFFEPALVSLRDLSIDSRWRMREAVRFGLQRLLAQRWPETLEALEGWVRPGAWLEMRAAATGVAEPSLLKDSPKAAAALQLHSLVIDQLLLTSDRKNDAFKALRKGLAYSLSVVVSALPEDGFTYMRKLAASHDSDALWILKQNLKKSRLVKHFPHEVEAIRRKLPA
ncbi:MAG: hypothetical protein PVH41_12460 [Anaerolineae bacterium]